MRPLVLVGAAVLLLAAAALRFNGPGPGSAAVSAGDPAGGPGSPVALPDELAASYREPGAALRQGDFAAASERMAPLTSRPGVEGERARVILGLMAHAAGEVARAHELLTGAENESTGFDDLRLLILAECEDALGRPAAARAALARLLELYPGSPMRQRALLAAVTVLRHQGDLAGALQIVAAARREPLDDEIALELERRAWEVAGELGDESARREAARRLLVNFPIEASKLQVIELFRPPGGDLDWAAILPVDDLLRRARNLLAAEIHLGALTALEAVPAEERDSEWHLLLAQALTLDHQGRRALEALQEVAPGGVEAELEWRRARAALDASAVHRGRPAAPSAEREGLRRQALEHLRRVVRTADGDLAPRALRLLFAELESEERFEEAMATLRELRRQVPGDTTGARWLWRRGWREFAGGNETGAIGHWTELGAIYPESRFARAGEYWTARAHEQLGNRDRAQTILRRIAEVDTTDFYRKHALRRLDGSAPVPVPAAPASRQSWPRDPLLSRAALLSEAGLDELALSELEATRLEAERRAGDALEAVILGRLDRRRESLTLLWRVFPQLGEPNQASVPEDARRLYYPMDFHDPVSRYAELNDISPFLVFAMIRQESAFDPEALSRAGARGLMQLMPATGRELAGRLGLSYSITRLNDPEFSVRLGTSYFRQMLNMFGGEVELALAGYNGGPYRIKRLWQRAGAGAQTDRFLDGLELEETSNYVKRILLFTDSYQQLY